MDQLYSPKQVARAIGASESSLKRWCDDGLLPFERTPGGHRRVSVQAVLSFARERQRPIVDPEVLGLPATSGRGEFVVRRGRDNFREALLAGDEDRARQVLVDLLLADIPLHETCDHVVAAAFHDIGDLWACDEIEVYKERRGCEIAVRSLLELRRLSAPTAVAESAPVAIGGTVEGDHYVLPTTMVELVLAGLGWRARSLGTSLPFETLVKAIASIRPRFFWLSVAHVEDESRFLEGTASIRAVTEEHGVRVILGGRGVTDTIRTALPDALACADFSSLVDAVSES